MAEFKIKKKKGAYYLRPDGTAKRANKKTLFRRTYSWWVDKFVEAVNESKSR